MTGSETMFSGINCAKKRMFRVRFLPETGLKRYSESRKSPETGDLSIRDNRVISGVPARPACHKERELFRKPRLRL